MASPFFGQISYRNIPHSRTVRRFIEKRIQQWILNNPTLTTPSPTTESSSTRYFVSIQREKEGHGVNCQIEIDNGRMHWRSVEYASNLHQALIRAVNHLIPAQPHQYA